ncbi:MAG: ROK family protein [Pseudomonadota bacterium]
MILCFDIGGSRIKAALAGPDGLRSLGDAPTPLGDFSAFLGVLAQFRHGHAVRAVAIAIAGVVEPETGRIRVANIPCADGRVLGAEILAALGLPVLVLNDADCFALAEARQGAGRGHRNVFGVILGTGVGGGVVIDGRLVTGAGGYAGEWGHGPVLMTHAAGRDIPHFACGCGQSGCVDTVGGARGLERLYLHLNGSEMRSQDILEHWEAGDRAAGRVIEVWLALVAPPLALVLNTLGSSIVPVGGGLSNVPALIAELDVAVRRMILRRTDTPLLVRAECRIEPGLIGAAEAGRAAFDLA